MDTDTDTKPKQTNRGRKKEDITDLERYERQKARVRNYKNNKRHTDEEYRLKINEANRLYHQNIRDNAKIYIEAMKKEQQAETDAKLKEKQDEADAKLKEEEDKLLKENEDILESMLEKILLKREALKKH
tara:strand:+ start:944 stop:1333 length:390 start_codon:yes stop_codon:yes gene_type:complete